MTTKLLKRKAPLILAEDKEIVELKKHGWVVKSIGGNGKDYIITLAPPSEEGQRK